MMDAVESSKLVRRIIFRYFIFCCVNSSFAQHDEHIKITDKPSTHGMLLMGTEKIYASHLPMFHSPHYYQIILELELSKADKQKYLMDKNKNPNITTYTIEPETFILPDMLNHPKPFKVNLYRGHFERGGTEILKNVPVKIVAIVYFQKFKVEELKSKIANFIMFGNLKEQFLAHQITNSPDFDQIVEVKTNLNQHLKNRKFAILNLDNAQNYPIGVSGNELKVNDKSVFLLKQLYLEFDDLKN
jgi:hypothetical protein